MPYIESHTSLKDEPKLLDLAEAMTWETDLALGKLHRFWYWCVDHAESGDLRKFNDGQLGRAVGLNGADCERFVKAMKKSGWIDEKPLFRVHDWWDYLGRYLQGKYSKQPDRWKAVQALYADRLAETNRKPVGFPQQTERTRTEKIERPLTAVESREDGLKAPLAPGIPAPRTPSHAQVVHDARAEQLMDLDYPIPGHFKGWKIRDLPSDYVEKTLGQIDRGELTRIGAQLQTALRLSLERRREAAGR